MVQSARRRPPGGRRYFPRRKVCAFCVDHVKTIDYKDVPRLRRFISDWAKIESRRKTGTCSHHQRALTRAIKRARLVALLPFTGAHTQIELGRQDGPRSERFRTERRERSAPRPVRSGEETSTAPVQPARAASETGQVVAVPTPPLVETPAPAGEPIAAATETQISHDEGEAPKVAPVASGVAAPEENSSAS
jgi:small subunit ribosomal protein S18